jgi:hypothetical protein
MGGCLWLLLPMALCAQPTVPKELATLLQGKTRYADIAQTVNNFYTNAKARLAAGDSMGLRTINRQLKMWQRWHYFNRPRLNPDGTLGNAALRNAAAFEQEQQARQPQTTLSAAANWQPIGPTNFNTTGGWNGGMGRVNCVAVHPTNPNMLYAGTANGGLWRRDNIGAWLSLTDALPAISIGGIVVNYNNPNQIFILTGDGEGSVVGNVGLASQGVFVSNNGGFSWAKAGSFPGIASTYHGYKLMQDPTAPSIFFACTTDGLYRSTDYCASWSLVSMACRAVTDLEFKPGDHNVLYAAVRGCSPRFFRSTDNGLNWNGVWAAGVDTATRIAIGVSANQPDWVYLLAGPSAGVGMYNGLYGSVNSGQSFARIRNTPNILGYDINGQDAADQSSYDLAIAINPANANQVFTGGIDGWSSDNGGATFVKRAHWDTRAINQTNQLGYIHADIHQLEYFGSRLYACTDGGLSFSDNHGISWTNIWNGMQIAQVYNMAAIEADINHIAMGTQDNGTMYRRGNSFLAEHIAGGDGFSAVIDPANISNMYMTVNTGVYYTNNAGASILNVTPSGGGAAWPNLTHNINNFSELLAGYDNTVFKFYPGVGAWSSRGAAGNVALVSCPSSANRLLAAGSANGSPNRLYRSENAGDSWEDISGKPGFPTNQPITDIAVSPANSAFIYVTIGGFISNTKVYRSTNFGDTWTNITGNLPNVATLSVAIGTSGGIYVGNDLGVYYNSGTGTVWQPFYNGLPKCPVTDLLVNLPNNRIRAATFGRGVWESDLYSPCGGSLPLNGPISGHHYYEAGSSITSTQQVSGGSNTEVAYRSSRIVLQPGIQTPEVTIPGMRVTGTDTRFKATAGPCATGLPIFRQLPGDSTVYYWEELDTHKNPPIQRTAYYKAVGRDVHLYLPQPVRLEMGQQQNGTVHTLLKDDRFAAGLYRLQGMAAIMGQLQVMVNGQRLVPVGE